MFKTEHNSESFSHKEYIKMADKKLLNDDLFFADESKEPTKEKPQPWKLLIVDDDEEIHRLTRMAMQDFSFDGRGIDFISAYSGSEAKTALQENPDTAILLLDVVMESNDSGLDVVRHVREVLGNHFIRIILRTGRPGHAPEKKIISEYDINDYKEKTELTIQKLTSSVVSALRTYHELHVIDTNRKEHIIQFHTVFYSSATAMSIVAPEGDLLKVNPRLTSLTGYSNEEMLGMTELDITLPEDRETTRLMHEDLIADRITFAEYEKRYLKKNGSWFWGHLTTSCVRDANGKPLYFVNQMQDITRRKQDQESLKKANLELAAFAHTVAHDLRNPLTPIIAYTHIVKENYSTQLDKNGHRMLDTINNQAQKILSMIEDLLILAEKGELACPINPVDSNEVLSEVIEELDSVIKESGATIIKKHLPIVRIPQNMLAQLFSNLIGNAVRYAGGKGSPIEVSGERKEGCIRFIVRDHGLGVPLLEREEIFKLYYRGAEHKHIHGTGVGLATVQKIAQMYDGNVWVEETLGGGSTFIIELIDCKPDLVE